MRMAMIVSSLVHYIMDKILQTLTSQIPMLIMAINNGTGVASLMPLMIIPLVMYIIYNFRTFYDYLFMMKIPVDYISYHIDDFEPSNKFPVLFQENLSIFLNNFYPASIKTGVVRNYYKTNESASTLFSCYCAIISPNDHYFSEIVLDHEIIDSIKKIGFDFASININNLIKYPIYVSIGTKKIENKTDNNQVSTEHKDRIKISAIDMKTAENFIYIVNNYILYKMNDINNFALTKSTYYYFDDNKYYGQKKIVTHEIKSVVNVNKNYCNVFLTKKNHKKITSIVTSWINNKSDLTNKGIPNKLGFMLTGSPGSGKTSVIYAIANETKKHIINIDLKNYLSNEFLTLMSTIQNKVVVFDDIDAHYFLHDRRKIKNNDIMDNIDNTDQSGIDYKKLYHCLSDRSMTIDVILEVFDGYNYLNNCILILTSNHPELLDPAVSRPGRIDHVINFDLCDEYQFRNIFKYYVGHDYNEIDPTFVFKEHILSTSYIINTVILLYYNKPAKILSMLNDIDLTENQQ